MALSRLGSSFSPPPPPPHLSSFQKASGGGGVQAPFTLCWGYEEPVVPPPEHV